MQCSSRVSAWRRELNSLNAASREHHTDAAAWWRDSETSSGMRDQCKDDVKCARQAGDGKGLKASYRGPPRQIESLHCVGALGFQSVRRAAASVFSYIHGRQQRLEDLASHGRRRAAGSILRRPPKMPGACQARPLGTPATSLPNPSFKPSPNSKTPGPRCSVGVHFLQRGPGVLLPVPA